MNSMPIIFTTIFNAILHHGHPSYVYVYPLALARLWRRNLLPDVICLSMAIEKERLVERTRTAGHQQTKTGKS